MSTKYILYVPVRRVDGHQVFEVEAESESEAKSKFMAGGGRFVTEELEVVSLDNQNIHIETKP